VRELDLALALPPRGSLPEATTDAACRTAATLKVTDRERKWRRVSPVSIVASIVSKYVASGKPMVDSEVQGRCLGAGTGASAR